MNVTFRSTYRLTVATIKIWFRDKTAIFWNFVMPVIIMTIFGVMNFGSLNNIDIGIVDLADNEFSRNLVNELTTVESTTIYIGMTMEDERQSLLSGDRHLVLVIPSGFLVDDQAVEMSILYNEGRPQEVYIGRAVINEILHSMMLNKTGLSRMYKIKAEPVTDREFNYIDFLLPGIVAMSIMQMGLFSVAFSFIQLKRLGVLRRLFATPVRPTSMLFAQVTTRLLVSMIQTLLLISIAVFFFDAKVVGSIISMIVVAILGGSVFLTMGFAVAGWARNENIAAPLANVIALPMIFLSGVFFGRQFLPEVLQKITDHLPLTYLVEALRNISSNGASIWSQGGNLIGLGIWLILGFILATRLFRWE